MIVKETDVKTYLPTLNLKMASSRMNEFLAIAEEAIIDRILGDNLGAALNNEIQSGATDEHVALRAFTKRAICQTAFLDAIPELDLQLSEAGFVVQSNQAVSPASKDRVEKLKEGVAQLKSKALDALTRFLINNSSSDASKYAAWRGTQQFAFISSGMIFSLDEYKRNFASVKSFEKVVMTWDGYFKMIPKMRTILHSIVAEYLSDEFVDELLEKKRDSEELTKVEERVLENVCEAVVAGSIDNETLARQLVIKARNIMINNIDSFETFRNSKVYHLESINIGDGAVANLL